MPGFLDPYDRRSASATGRIVVGVSTSPAGLQALRYGVMESRRRRTPLCAVRVFCFDPPWRGPEVRHFRDEFVAEGWRYVHQAFDTAMAGIPNDIEVQIETPNTRVEQGLVSAARHSDDVLVLGGHTQRRLPGRLIRYCLRHASCPVVVVPPPDLARVCGRGAVRGLFGEIARLMRSPASGA